MFKPRSALSQLVYSLTPSLQKALRFSQSQLSGLLLGPLQYPLIGLHLFISLSHPHAAITAARLIFLINTPLLHLFSPHQKPQWQNVGRGKSSLGCGADRSAWPCLLTLQPCPPPAPPSSDPGRPLDSRSPGWPMLSFLCTLAHTGPSWAGPPAGALLPPLPPHWPTDLSCV